MAVGPPVWAAGGKATELKFKLGQNGNYQLYHNLPVNYFNVANLLDTITLGTSNADRIGNRIFVKQLDIIMVLNNKTDRPNVSYRVAVCAAPASANTDSWGEHFGLNGFTGIHAPSNSQLLYDQTFPLNQGSGMENNVTPNKERSFNHRLSIPLNHAVNYNINDSTASTRLIAFVAAYDSYGTLTTDNIASIAQTTYRILFTDC